MENIMAQKNLSHDVKEEQGGTKQNNFKLINHREKL